MLYINILICIYYIIHTCDYQKLKGANDKHQYLIMYLMFILHNTYI